MNSVLLPGHPELNLILPVKHDVLRDLSIYPEKTLMQKDTWTPVFTEAPIARARTWKQPKYPLTGEQICDGILLSQEQEGSNAICSHVNGPRDDHTKRSESERHDITHTGNLKSDADELIYRLTHRESKLTVTKGGRGGGSIRGFVLAEKNCCL